MEEHLLSALQIGDSELLAIACDEHPVDRRDRFVSLLHIYRLLTGPLLELGHLTKLGTHPAITALKWRLESAWLAELGAVSSVGAGLPDDRAVDGLRVLAAHNRLPDVYRWVAAEATLPQLQVFLAAEGGPDGSFDDLVAACQIGLGGSAKLELARNYWDEMGNGTALKTHTVLHHNMLEALGIKAGSGVEGMSEKALERAAFGGLLATNHWLQPEMLGALAVVELQAGPRCRLVVQAMERLGLPGAAREFYQVHAEVDPRHGQDWLANAIVPMARAGGHEWSQRIQLGARWRIGINDGFLDELYISFANEAAACAT